MTMAPPELVAPVLLAIDPRGVATVTLNRPERGNAYDEALLAALIDGLASLAARPDLRAVVIRGAGKHFQAGADIDWLARASAYPPEQAFAASMATTRAMQMLNEFPHPTLAVVHGACFGGGCGLVCCVDVALATEAAVFGLTEVRVGVAPSPISTHMVHAMGLRHTRRYALPASASTPRKRFASASSTKSSRTRRWTRASRPFWTLFCSARRGRSPRPNAPSSAPTALPSMPARWRCLPMKAGCSAIPPRGAKARRRFAPAANQLGIPAHSGRAKAAAAKPSATS